MSKQWKLNVWLAPPQTKSGHCTIEIPPAIADEILGPENKKRLILTFNNGKSYHRALQRYKEGYALITIGKTTLKDAQKEVGLEEQITLKHDTSEFGMQFPEEFKEVLKQEPGGEEMFRKLLAGRQRNILYYISSAKTSETRIKRSFQMLNRIQQGDFN